MPQDSKAERRDRIRDAISKLRRGAQRRYPPQLRTQIAEYGRDRVQNGVPLTRVCSELGVGQPTLVRMLEETKKTPGLRRVRIAPPKAAMPDTNKTLVVRGPAGIVVDGLDVEGIAALVRALA